MSLFTINIDIDIDFIHHTLLGIYIVIFVLSREKQIRSIVAAMADALPPQTPPKKLFKPSSKTRTPTRVRPSPQSSQPIDSSQKLARSAPRSITSESTGPLHETPADNIVKSTRLAPLTSMPTASDRPAESADSNGTGETPAGLVEDNVLTPAETASRSTGPRSPLSRHASQHVQRSPPSFRETMTRGTQPAKEPTDELAKNINGRPPEALETATSSLFAEVDNINNSFNSPTDIARYFREQGNTEMSNFVASLAGQQSLSPNDGTSTAAMSPGSGTPSPAQRNNLPGPAQVSKAADGTFRDTPGAESTAQPTSKIGEPNVSNISQAAKPAVLGAVSGNKQQPPPRNDDKRGDAHIADNMGRPVQVQRSIDIPLQRSGKAPNGSPNPERQRRESQDLGDFEDLPGTEKLPSTGNLPDISEIDSQDPPEEILDPSVHATSSTSITPIPKIGKISPIDFSRPADLERLAKGLAGRVIDDIGNIVGDTEDEVLGHATGDLPAMVGKKVSESGEVYDDDGEVIGYVSENFTNPPSPTEIPTDFLGRLRVDHKGNILDSDGNIIGRFHQPPAKKGTKPKSSGKPAAPKTGNEDGSKEGQKPKVNAQTGGGSPSDLFLDVKSTTDGIQLTIRIPTTFSQPPPNVSSENGTGY